MELTKESHTIYCVMLYNEDTEKYHFMAALPSYGEALGYIGMTVDDIQEDEESVETNSSRCKLFETNNGNVMLVRKSLLIP